MKKKITGICTLIFPSWLLIYMLRMLGHKISSGSKIGFSVLFVDEIVLDGNARIGNFNLINCSAVGMKDKSRIGNLNKIVGNISISLQQNATIGNRNSIYRNNHLKIYTQVRFSLGVWGEVVHNASLDCTRSIAIGNYTTIGGSGTQFWTHGYYHGREGVERIRVDGEINIGNNVYVGSRCTFNPGVKVADRIHIGSNCTISKSLAREGMYVSQPLRFIENNIEMIKEKLSEVRDDGMEEIVYEKPIQ